MTLPIRPSSVRATTLTVLAVAALAACGGSDDDDTAPYATPVVVSGAAEKCAALGGQSLPADVFGEPTRGAVVTAASYQAAVPDAPNAGGTALVRGTPDHCQVLVDIQPVDATAPLIKSQVNLPASWNGKSLQLGGGGLNGTLVTGLGRPQAAGPELPLPLTRGYMTLGTDSGHQVAAGVSAAAFSLNDEALVNYAYASYKKTRDLGVELARRYYGLLPQRAYYIGGSEGGREGLLMAQRYPADFDGIVVVDPVIRLTGLWQFQLSMGQVQSSPGTWLGGKTQLVQDTVAAACDAEDGIVDNVVSNPFACKPLATAALVEKRCASGNDDGAGCFSDGQLETLRWIHTGQLYPFDLANGLNSYPGYLFGSEGVPGALDFWVIGTAQPTADSSASGVPGSYGMGAETAKYFYAKDPAFNPLNFNAAAFQPRLQELSALMDMTDPDLGAFHARGGKLILRENLSDKGNSPQTGFDYYDAVVDRLGQATVDDFFVAYGATGLPHTSPGLDAGTVNAPAYGTPGEVDLLGLIDDWVVNGSKPAESVTLANRQPLPPHDVKVSKPMCRFGFYPRYTGSTPDGGSLAANYSCTPN